MKRPAAITLTLAAAALIVGAGCTQHASNGLSAISTKTSDPVTHVTTTTTTPPPGPAPPTTGIRIGPGPQATYNVQPQPAPGSCHYSYVGSYPLPDPNCTPGAINPQVTQVDIDSTICSTGFTSTIRPPEDVTEPEKDASAAAYGYAGSSHVAEYDHLIPLELGGDPNDPANLWVEPPDNPNATSFANTKDQLESRLNSLVCSGQITLAAAQQAIASNWVAAHHTYGG
jgi:hypothetical protein